MAFVGCAGLGNSSRCLSLFGHAHREGALVAVYAGKPAREYIRTNLPGVSLPD